MDHSTTEASILTSWIFSTICALVGDDPLATQFDTKILLFLVKMRVPIDKFENQKSQQNI